MDNINNVWGFVEQYFPNYTSSDYIAENDDLHKIINGELNGQAEEMYNAEMEEQRIFFGGTLSDSELEAEVLKIFQTKKSESDAYVFGKAIEGYLETLK